MSEKMRDFCSSDRGDFWPFLSSFDFERDPLLLELEEEARRESIPIIGPWAGRLLSFLVRSGGARRALELGMLYHHHVPPKDLESFYIDRCEVTNREFKAFIDDGGYAEPSYWKEAFNECRIEEAVWEKVMDGFRDATDQPGPAKWRDGTYAADKDDYPVTGVSWFEAAAYSRYRNKMLPSVYHWAAAATPYHAPDMLPLSNIGMEREPAAVGRPAAAADRPSDAPVHR